MIIAKITKVKYQTPRVKSFRIKFDSIKNFNFKPGQFTIISLPDYAENNILVRRAYSIASCPENKKYLEIAVVNNRLGRMASHLHQLKKGSSINIEGPFGSFVLDEKARRVLFIAGGCGLSPIMSMLRHLLHKKHRKNNKNIIFILSVRTRRDIVFKKELLKLERKNKNLTLIITLSQDSWNSDNEKFKNKETGRINKKMLKKYLKSKNYSSYICGPYQMNIAMQKLLKSLRIKKISYENWESVKKKNSLAL